MSSNGRATPGEGVQEVAEDFFDALKAADGARVWELFSTGAREHVVGRAVKRGLDPALGQMLIEGTATGPVFGEYLSQLLAGLDHDLRDIRVPLLRIGEVSQAAGVTKVLLLEAFEIAVGPPLEPLPVGSLLMVVERGKWRVERLVVRPGG